MCYKTSLNYGFEELGPEGCPTARIIRQICVPLAQGSNWGARLQGFQGFQENFTETSKRYGHPGNTGATPCVHQ